MSELLKAFDSYNEFERSSYFTLTFNTLSSTLTFKASLNDSKEHIEKVLELMNLSKNNYELIFQDWSTEDSSNADFGKDYPYQLLYKSTQQKSIIWISLEDDTLSVYFLYDCSDTVLEKWVIEMNHTLRTNLGLSRTPTFKVLTKSHSNFHTEDVRTEKTVVDIVRNYNDDFIAVNNCIQDSIKDKESGLILLYGNPGTGKTTYIKSLITDNQGANFIFIQNEFVSNLLDPDFISFLLKQRNSILVIEDAEKVITSREHIKEDSVVSTILQLTDGLFSDYLNIKVICSFNTNLSKIDTALLRKGRLIAMYEFKALSVLKTNNLLKELGTKTTDEELTISDIYNTNKKTYSNIEKSKIGF